jgi:hypothetical protein
MRRLSVVLAILRVTAGAPAEGQRLPAEFPRYHPRPVASQQPETLPKPQRPNVKDYTLEGAAIGGLALGVFGAYFGRGMCGMDDGGGRNCALATLTGFLSGASVGATIGGIIGSAKKKTPQGRADTSLTPVPGEQQPHVRVHADTAFPSAPSHGGNGAALGAVMIGGAAAAFTALGCGLDQSGGHEDCAWKSLKRGTIGAVIGGLTGALVSAVLSPGARDP